jgi:hypothetical protein
MTAAVLREAFTTLTTLSLSSWNGIGDEEAAATWSGDAGLPLVAAEVHDEPSHLSTLLAPV